MENQGAGPLSPPEVPGVASSTPLEEAPAIENPPHLPSMANPEPPGPPVLFTPSSKATEDGSKASNAPGTRVDKVLVPDASLSQNPTDDSAPPPPPRRQPEDAHGGGSAGSQAPPPPPRRDMSTVDSDSMGSGVSMPPPPPPRMSLAEDEKPGSTGESRQSRGSHSQKTFLVAIYLGSTAYRCPPSLTQVRVEKEATTDQPMQ